VHSEEFDAATVFENFRSAYEGNVVVMDNVEAPFQDPLNTGRLQEWEAGLMGSQRRKKAPSALESMHGHIGMIQITLCGFPASQYSVRINTVNHFHLMSALRQLVGQSMHEDSVSPEIVGRIEGCDHAEAKGSIFHLFK
jgi:hypothetical protein